ncbi:MAG: TonB-dependent receptor [bacterium]
MRLLHRAWPCFVLLLLCGILAPTHLHADDGDTKHYVMRDTITVIGKRYLTIPEISAIATKLPAPLLRTPASIGVVTRALFDHQNGIVMGDALKNVSGVNVQNNFGIHDFFLIRGFESLSSGLVLTDGAAEPEVSFYNLYNIERVEVLKGPGAFLYGGNPLSGAVNLVRKQPLFQNFAFVSGSYGNFNSFRSTFDVGLNNGNDNLAFRLNGLWQDSENYRDQKDHLSYAINPAVTWSVDNRTSITANFEYVNSENKPDSGIPILFQFGESPLPKPVAGLPEVRRTQSYQTPLDISNQELFRIRLDFKRDVNTSFTLRNKFYFTQLNWQSVGTLLNGAFADFTVPGKFIVLRRLNSLDDQQKLIGNQLESLLNFRTGILSHQVVVGIETAWLDDDFHLNLAELPALDLFEPDESIASMNQLQPFPIASGEARSFVFAPYFISQTSFSEKLQLFYGGRLDIIDYDDERTDLVDLKRFLLLDSKNKRNYQKFSPMVGLVVSPQSNLTVYANAAQSFAPPSTLTLGSPKPEESVQYELGSKLKLFDGRLTTSLALFYLEKSHIDIPDDVTGVPQQTGDQRSQGVEFEIAALPARGLHTFFNYAFTDAELTEFREFNFLTNQIDDHSGRTPAFAPKHIMNFWVTQSFKNGLSAGTGLRYVSSQFIDEDNLYKIDDYLTWDATLHFTYDNFRWSLNVKNITDRAYETRGFNAFSVTPANPRAFYGSMDFVF